MDNKADKYPEQGNELFFSQNLPVLYVILDCNGRIVSLNKRLAEVLKANAEEVAGSLFNKFLEDISRQEFDNEIQNCYKTGEIINKDFCFNCGNNRTVTLSVNGIVTNLNNKKSSRIHLIFENITKLKETQLRDITENVPGIVHQNFISPTGFSFIYISDNIKNILGYSADDIIKNQDIKNTIIFKDDFSRITSSLQTSVKDGNNLTISFRVIKKNGDIAWLRSNFSCRQEGSQMLLTGVSTDITQEMKTKVELQDTKNRFQAVANSSLTGITTYSRTGIILSVNPTVCQLSGYTEDELIGKHFTKLSLFRKKDIPNYIKIYRNGLSGKFPEEPVEFMWKHKSGETRWAEGFLNTVKENDKVVALQVLSIDITDRKNMEEKIRQDGREKEFLFNVAQEMLLINELDDLYKFYADTLHEKLPGSYIIVNHINDNYTKLTVKEIRGISSVLKQTLKMTGTPLEGSEFKVDKNTFNYAKFGKLYSYNNSLFDLALKQIPFFICQKIEKAAGINKIYELSLGNRNVIEGGVAIVTTKKSKDIPVQVIENLGRLTSMSLDRIKAEINLKKSENNYRTLAENSPLLILRADKELSIIFLNKSAKEYIGSDSGISNICNLHDGKIVDELSGIWCNKIYEAFHTGREQKIELINRSDKLFFDWLIVPERDKNSSIVSIQVIGRDITQEKQNAAREIEEIETKNKVFSIIAHDLRGPFSSVSGFTELLSDNFDELSVSERNEYLRIIRDSSQSGFQLLESLMEWSRTNRELNFVKSGYFNLNDVITSCIELYAPKINMKNQTIINNIPDASIIYADYNIISTAIRNIFSNSIKFTPERGVIELILDHDTDADHIIIKDNGVGMNQKQINNLFGKDLMVSSKGTQNETGLGLGLKQTMEFLRKNNCSLSYTSQNGEGTTAKIFIPKIQK